MLEDGATEDWNRDNPLQQQWADPVLGQVIGWVEDGQRPERGALPVGDPDLMTYYVLFGRLRINKNQGLVYEGEGRAQVCLPDLCFDKVFKWAHQQPTAGISGSPPPRRGSWNDSTHLGLGGKFCRGSPTASRNRTPSARTNMCSTAL